jgi:ATP-dependent Clp protease ATP-binding subunit ClpC
MPANPDDSELTLGQPSDRFFKIVSEFSKRLYILVEKGSGHAWSLNNFIAILFYHPSSFVQSFLEKNNISTDDFPGGSDNVNVFPGRHKPKQAADAVTDFVMDYIRCGYPIDYVTEDHFILYALKENKAFRKYFSQFIEVDGFVSYLESVSKIYEGDIQAITDVSVFDAINTDGEDDDDDFDELPDALREYLSRQKAQSMEDPLNKEITDEDVLGFFTDVTEEVSEMDVSPAICREREIDDLIHILNKRTKPNCILTGDAGVGKTAVVEGLAYNIQKNIGNLGRLKGCKIFSLDICKLMAGTAYRGQAEERMNKVMEYFAKNENVVLFIDEIHMIVGAGGKSSDDSCDLANALKPHLSRGKIICIGATTQQEYERHIKKDSALERRFSVLEVKEPTSEQLNKIMDALKVKFEAFHGVEFDKDTLDNVIYVCKELMPNRKFPDKSIDVLDSYGSYLKIKEVKPSKENFLDFIVSKVVPPDNSSMVGFGVNRSAKVLDLIKDKIK